MIDLDWPASLTQHKCKKIRLTFINEAVFYIVCFGALGAEFGHKSTLILKNLASD